MDKGGPTKVTEPNFKEAVDEMMRAKTLRAKANAVLPDDLLEELFVCKLTEMIFPNAYIHFIAINNGVDSDNQTENDMTPFINIFNEFYAKDTSRKIRTISHMLSRPEYLGHTVNFKT